MKIFLVLILIVLLCLSDAFSKADSISLMIARKFGNQLFEMNGVGYLEPMVESVNATSNTSFFNQAFVPRKVKKPYFRLGLHTMTGIIDDDKKSYKPRLPMEKLDYNNLNPYATIDILNQKVIIKDTVGMIFYLFKTLLYDAVNKGRILIPNTTATILGSQNDNIRIPEGALESTFKEQLYYPVLSKNLKDSISVILNRFPSLFSLPPGSDINNLFVGIPQLEVGSFLGTELLLRYIPPINLGSNIGLFNFWGVGLKHSLSQYFNASDNLSDRTFDLSFQTVFQSSSLKNSIGVTNSQLDVKADFFNFNIHASKTFENILACYLGISYEIISMATKFNYFLPVETQQQLGLLEKKIKPDGSEYIDKPNPPEFPGDLQAQNTQINIQKNNFKFTAGISKEFGFFNLFLDYNYSILSVFIFGLEVKF